MRKQHADADQVLVLVEGKHLVLIDKYNIRTNKWQFPDNK